jgi:hypothetical protein
MKLFLLATVLAVTSLSRVTASADTINFDTGTASEWQATGGGAVNATPYVVYGGGVYMGNLITVTSDESYTGTFLPGGSLANFDGFWTATFHFSLPANASNVQLNFANFINDDRGVLELNGNIISSAGIPISGNYSGSMVFTDGGPLVPYTFTTFNSPNSSVTGTVNSGFNIGGVNTLTAIINNTYSGVLGPLTNIGPGDGTAMGLTGTISYSVPEPSAMAVMLIGLGSASFFRRSLIIK